MEVVIEGERALGRPPLVEHGLADTGRGGQPLGGEAAHAPPSSRAGTAPSASALTSAAGRHPRRAARGNRHGTFVAAQQSARRVRSSGAIVAFPTSVCRFAFPEYAVYVADKGAVATVALVLAPETRGRDVTVNAVAAGPTAAPMFLNSGHQPAGGSVVGYRSAYGVARAL
ncbi:SDR family oxidoreductase [Streptomyces sp. NBC_00670]|uniref:SDR family oxidoreductase n=1 Tax=Streptomyces sp. NBC_00670 TaxID=2975804 RepID=UPI003FA6B6F9